MSEKERVFALIRLHCASAKILELYQSEVIHDQKLLLAMLARGSFLFRRRTAEMDSFSAAEMSAPAVITCAGAGMCACCPNQRRKSSTSASVKRPSRLTGIPLLFAQYWATDAPTPR